MTRRLLACATVLALALAATTIVAQTAAALPTPPSAPSTVPEPARDPFYTPPAGLGATPDGTVLRSRPIVATAFALPLPVSALQLLYKTLDSNGQPTATVATVMVPLTPWTGHGQRPLVAYQTAEDSVGDQCAPSYVIRSPLGGLDSNAKTEMAVVASTLAKGWAVVTSDYEGRFSQLIAGPQSGYAVLDGVRAALTVPGFGPATPVALWGYSGGAFATAWASKLQSGHAPGLNVTAIALGGVPADLDVTMRNIDGGYGSGLIIGAITGLDRAYPEAGLNGLLTTSGRASFAAGSDDCSGTLITRYAFQPLKSFTTSATPYDVPALHAVLVANSVTGVGQAASAPVYDYHGLNDELVPVSIADTLVAQYCSNGTTVQRVRYLVGEHNEVLLAGSPGVQRFLAERFAGTAPENDC